MPIIDDTRDTQTAIAGPVNSALLAQRSAPEDSPSALDVLTAAARQSTIAGAITARALNQDPDMPTAPADWDPLDHIQGFEDYAHSLSDARTPSELEGRKARIREQEADKQVLARAGVGGAGASLAFALVDPSFYASAAVPEVAAGKAIMLGKVLTAAARGGVGAAAYEAGLQQLQESRTASESLLNISGGALLSGVLGHIAALVPKSDLAQAHNMINELARSEAGAAAVARPTTLEAETIGTGGETLSKITNKTPLRTDADIILNSKLVEARTALQELASLPMQLNKNAEGIATTTAVEDLIDKHMARVADFSDAIGDEWASYKKSVPSGTRLSKTDLLAEVATASRNGDTHVIPEVQRLAQKLRSEVFDPLYDQATKLGLASKVEEVVGAQSYFRRMYDRNVIRSNLSEWTKALTDHFQKSGADPLEVSAAVNDLTNQILHNDVGQSNWASKITVAKAGPLKERTLDIPDDQIAKFLVNDPLKIARAYVKDLAPQVELAKRFGDAQMTDKFQRITDEAAIQKGRITDNVEMTTAAKNAALKAIADDEKAANEALVRVRDRILGTRGRLSTQAGEGERRAVMASRAFRNYVLSTKLGAVALTGGLMDTARIAASYGFAPTIRNLARLVASPAYRALSYAQARKVGSAVEVALSRRLNIAGDGAVTEGWSQKLAEGLFKYSGLSHVTDFNRVLAATLFEDSVLRAATKGASKVQGAHLASLGIGKDELEGIAEQLKLHGGETDGIRVSGSADWADHRLANIYDAAILKESRIVVQQPGAADRVWWMDHEIGKLFGQLKTFSLSSSNRLLTPGLQMAGAGTLEGYAKFARFAGFMMMGGYLTHALRQTLAGQKPATDLSGAVNNAFTESGLGGVLPDVLDPVFRQAGSTDWGKKIGLANFTGAARYADRDLISAYAGPGVGAAKDLWTAAWNAQHGGVSAKDLHNLRRAIPGQNTWYLRRAINALEGETAESLNLEGATSQTFGQRLLSNGP